MLSDRQQHCLKGIGIRRCEVLPLAIAVPESEPRVKANPVIAKVAEAAPPTPEKPALRKPVIDVPLENWDAIMRSIQQCEACELVQNCTQKVPGIGNQQADLMIVGEGPGHDEDIRGEPFVGRSGQLLDKMLEAIGISRSQVFITNIVKCRPPNNRDPHVDEVASCRRYLQAQIEQIKPKVILSVGRVSAHSLLGTTEPVGRLITSLHQLPGSDIPVKVTYHPAYLLRTPTAKAIAWQDMKTVFRMLQA
ncbi:MAG: uracil-DNA glycosylase [Gammaproteobacteria bacterium]|nr:uracil-DNA glycosylase [Gammaproteobacteria bacterium]